MPGEFRAANVYLFAIVRYSIQTFILWSIRSRVRREIERRLTLSNLICLPSLRFRPLTS
jgi:hypothetical protein